MPKNFGDERRLGLEISRSRPSRSPSPRWKFPAGSWKFHHFHHFPALGLQQPDLGLLGPRSRWIPAGIHTPPVSSPILPHCEYNWVQLKRKFAKMLYSNDQDSFFGFNGTYSRIIKRRVVITRDTFLHFTIKFIAKWISRKLGGWCNIRPFFEGFLSGTFLNLTLMAY